MVLKILCKRPRGSTAREHRSWVSRGFDVAAGCSLVGQGLGFRALKGLGLGFGGLGVQGFRGLGVGLRGPQIAVRNLRCRCSPKTLWGLGTAWNL